MGLHRLAKACALAVAVVLGEFSAGAAHAADKKVYTLKLSHFVPPQHAFHKWVVKWTQKITKELHGRLKFQIYPNGQLVGPPNRQFDAARNGIVDIAWCLNGVTPGRYPMTELANLPFSWPSAGVDLPLMAKRLTELAPKYLASEYPGLHILFMNMANPVVVYSKEPIHSVADFKGKKIRYASTANKEMLDAMGAVPIAGAAAGDAGRARQGHRGRRHLPARSRPRLPSRLGRALHDRAADRPRPPSRWS